ncbi:MAG: hypothetical protein AAF961_01365 [Planctomycetota bacterium]
MITLRSGLAVLVVCLCFTAGAFAQKDEAAPESGEKVADKEEKKDPLEGLKCFMMKKRDVKGKKVMEYKGGELYLCCAACVKRMTKTPEKYEAKAHHQMVYTGQFTQNRCPLSGKELAEDAPMLKINGVETRFATSKHVDEVKKLEVDDQIERVFGKKGFKLGEFKLNKKPEKEEKAEEEKEAA